jgi:putative membrane protein
MLKSMLPAIASLALIGGFACSSSQKPAAQSPETTSATVSGASAQQQGEAMTTSDVFAVLRNLHNAEIDQGKLAEKKATDPRVKAFASEAIKYHQERLAKDQQLMTALNVQPRDNKVSDEIKSSAEKQISSLSSLSGASFDRTYIDDQVNYYRAALDTFDNTLIPGTADPQMKNNVIELRGRANRFLKEAQDLRLSLVSQPQR